MKFTNKCQYLYVISRYLYVEKFVIFRRDTITIRHIISVIETNNHGLMDVTIIHFKNLLTRISANSSFNQICTHFLGGRYFNTIVITSPVS